MPSKKQIGRGFTKMTGAGNDFIIVDARKDLIKIKRPEFAKKICDRHFGVGADGVFFIEKTKTKGVDFKWDFYNADGSVAEMCGNGARCVARFAFDNKIAKKTMQFETMAGVVGAKVNKNRVQVQMTPPKIIFKSIYVPYGESEKIEVAYWNTGVPHVVKKTDDWSAEYLDEVGAYLRNHDAFKKTNGANATFYEKIGTSHIQAATYERGVEAVTLACGTGAVAAAAQAFIEGEASPIRVDMPGGQLVVKIEKDFKKVTLEGEANYICVGVLSSEATK